MSDETPLTKRRVLVVTVGRSDYGIYRPVLDAMEASERLSVELLVSGAHLGEGGQVTFAEIKNDNRNIVAQIPLPPTGANALSVGQAMAAALAGGCEAMARLKPDILVVLGDRFEMFGFAAAAVPLNIPVAHIHGGELSFGAIDDVFRHAITKIAHLHFAATAEYARRIRQMGEEDWRVHVSGAPALDTVRKRALPSRAELEKRFSLHLDRPPILVTHHPETRNPANGVAEFRALLAALEATGLPIVLTAPNADVGSNALRVELLEFVARVEHAYFVESFGAENYLAMLREAACVVGNSSSGIIETPIFKVPTVNIGDRQAGRIRAINIIDAPVDYIGIKNALALALSDDFKSSLLDIKNPYGDGFAGKIITTILSDIDIDKKLLQKKFIDLPDYF